jgi:hypothetical protein
MAAGKAANCMVAQRISTTLLKRKCFRYLRTCAARKDPAWSTCVSALDSLCDTFLSWSCSPACNIFNFSAEDISVLNPSATPRLEKDVFFKNLLYYTKVHGPGLFTTGKHGSKNILYYTKATKNILY